MIKKEYSVSAIQIFFIMFSFVFSGLFMYGKGSLTSIIFACFFLSVICIVAGVVCAGYHGSKMLFGSLFGKTRPIAEAISLIPLSISAVKDISSFSLCIDAFYGGESAPAIFCLIIAICVFAVWHDTLGAARFCELCFFPICLVVLLSLLGEKSNIFYFSIAEKDIFSAFDIIGCIAVVFSLYLRVLTPKNEAMSDFARNGTFHPSPIYCGAVAPICALVVYIVVIILGVRSNILANYMIWFCCLARSFAFTICACEISNISECLAPHEKAKRFSLICVAFSAAVLMMQYLSEKAIACAEIFYNTLFPCVVFICFAVRTATDSEKIY